MHCGAMSPVGRSDTAPGDQSPGGRFRLGHVIGLASSALRSPCRLNFVVVHVEFFNGPPTSPDNWKRAGRAGSRTLSVEWLIT